MRVSILCKDMPPHPIRMPVCVHSPTFESGTKLPQGGQSPQQAKEFLAVDRFFAQFENF